MRSFRYNNIPLSAYTEVCLQAQSKLHEYMGRFDALRQPYATLLGSLEHQTLLDSVNASLRIDGIYIDKQRIANVIEGAQPLTDRERQAAGYGRILRAFRLEPEKFAIDASTFLAMHTVLLGGVPAKGGSSYRQKDYLDMMIDGRVQRVPASPVLAFETPLYLGSACDNLASAFDTNPVKRLLLIPTFTVDVMCIKPFDEGTARLCRAFSSLLMEKAGIDIYRYVSIDRLCEQRAKEYYEALNQCLESWNSAKCNYSAYVSFWLSCVQEAYETIFRLIGANPNRVTSKTQKVKDFFAMQTGQHTKQQVMQALPDVSVSTIENSLAALVKEGYLEKLGRGRSTSYRRCGEK